MGHDTLTRAAAPTPDTAITTGGTRRGRRRRSSQGPVAPVLARSGLDADDRVPVGCMLVGVCDPHEEWVAEEAPDELHADGEPGRRLAHRQGERRVAGVVKGLGIAGAAAVYRREVILDSLEVAARRLILWCCHEASGHYEHIDVRQGRVVGLDIGWTHILGLGVHAAVVVATAELGGDE